MADYRGKANKLEEKKSFFCVTASNGLNGPYFTHFPLLKFFFIKEMTSLMNHVRFGTVIAYTVFDLISEHALISEHPLFSSFFNFFFERERDPVIIISGPSHATTFGSSVLHPE